MLYDVHRSARWIWQLIQGVVRGGLLCQLYIQRENEEEEEKNLDSFDIKITIHLAIVFHQIDLLLLPEVPV
jgi:hypothetical protein